MEMKCWWEQHKDLKLKGIEDRNIEDFKDEIGDRNIEDRNIEDFKDEIGDRNIEDFKDEIEDLTGCIPLLLESCIEDGKFNLYGAAVVSVWKEVAKFATRMRKNGDWERYAT